MKFAMKCFDKTSKYAIFLSNAGQQNAPSYFKINFDYQHKFENAT